MAREGREIIKDMKMHLEAIYGEVALAEDSVPTIDSDLSDDGILEEEFF